MTSFKFYQKIHKYDLKKDNNRIEVVVLDRSTSLGPVTGFKLLLGRLPLVLPLNYREFEWKNAGKKNGI